MDANLFEQELDRLTAKSVECRVLIDLEGLSIKCDHCLIDQDFYTARFPDPLADTLVLLRDFEKLSLKAEPGFKGPWMIAREGYTCRVDMLSIGPLNVLTLTEATV